MFLSDLRTAASSRASPPRSCVAARRPHQRAFSLTERDNLHLMADEPVMNQVEWGRAASPSAGVSFFIHGQQKAHKHQSALNDNTQRFALPASFNKVVSRHLVS